MRLPIPALLALLTLSVLAACASGPHPSIEVASKDFECPSAELTRTEIYPKKQKFEGCGKEAIFILGCAGYGANESCEWVRQPPGGK